MAEASEKEYLTPTRTELFWPGKRTQVERVALPFQVVETVNQSRATREQTPMLGLPAPPLFEAKTDSSWRNKLVWGENKYVMASLLQGDPSVGLEPLAGKIDLIYIDPPFATGEDFSIRIRLGDLEWTKEASMIEEKAYRDTWGKGVESYIRMLYDRLVLMRDLLAEQGEILIHIGSNINHMVRVLMDEVFGPENFRNEIIVKRGAKNVQAQFQTIDSLMFGYDTLLLYTKSATRRFPHLRRKLDEVRPGTWNNHWRGTDRPTMRYELFGIVPERGQWRWSRERTMRAVDSYEKYLSGFADKMSVDEYYSWVLETGEELDFVRLGSTGRPEHYVPPTETQLLNDVWLDITAYERTNFPTQKSEDLLQRIIEWLSENGALVADFFCGSGTMQAVAEKLGRRWIGCDLSRFAIQVTRKRLLDIADCQPFEVLNLSKYERQYWQMNVLNGEQEDGSRAIGDYLRFIVALYHAEPVEGYAHLHGQKAGRWVHVGATDASVSRDEVMDSVRECQANRYTALDVLGWEWEMGLHDTVWDEARGLGVDLRLLYIPREVMDKRAVEAGDVHFYELAYLKTSLLQDSLTVTVRLDDFIIPNPDLVPDEVRSKVKKWSDYIDFWAVDWNYAGDTFHNEWQTYRTRKSPTLRLISDPNTYAEAGKYRILVKVIDIFGNDTTQLLEVAVS